MRPSFAATLLVCGTILTLFPFVYHLTIHANTSMVLANRADTAPNADWSSHGPKILPLQGAVGITGVIFLAVGFIGGTGILSKREKKEKDVRVPLDIVLKAHAPEAAPQSQPQVQQALPPANSNPAAAPPSQETGKIGVRRIA